MTPHFLHFSSSFRLFDVVLARVRKSFVWNLKLHHVWHMLSSHFCLPLSRIGSSPAEQVSPIARPGASSLTSSSSSSYLQQWHFDVDDHHHIRNISIYLRRQLYICSCRPAGFVLERILYYQCDGRNPGCRHRRYHQHHQNSHKLC